MSNITLHFYLALGEFVQTTTNKGIAGEGADCQEMGQTQKVGIRHGCCKRDESRLFYCWLVVKNLGEEYSFQCTNLAAKQRPVLNVDMRLIKCNNSECGAMGAFDEYFSSI